MQWHKYRIWIGLVVLAALIGVSVWALSTQTGETPPDAVQTPALPEIDRAAISQIEIRRPDEEPIRLVKREGHWRIAAPVDAPAAESAMNNVLETLDELEVTGVASRNRAAHEQLEVDAAHGLRVTVRAGQETVIDFWLGALRGGRTMLRLEGQDQVLETRSGERGSYKFAFNKPARDWRDRTITTADAEQVRELTVTNTNGTFHFRKGESAWEEVVAEGGTAIERFDAGRVRSLVSSLARLTASDFAGPDVTAEQAGLGEGAASVTMVVGEGDSQQTLRLVVGGESDAERHDRYARLEGNDTIYVISRYLAERVLGDAASFQRPEPGTEPPPPPPGGEGGEGGPAPQIDQAQLQQLLQQLQQQGGGGGGHP